MKRVELDDHRFMQSESIRNIYRGHEDVIDMSNGDFLRDMDIDIVVHSKYDYEIRQGPACHYEQLDVREIFGDADNMMVDSGLTCNHDGRHYAVRQHVNGFRYPGLIKMMIDILTSLLRLRMQGSCKGSFALYCTAGRHRSVASAIWLAQMFMLMNVHAAVFMCDRAHSSRHQSRMCSCRDCNWPQRTPKTLLLDMRRALDEMAEAVVHPDYAIWRRGPSDRAVQAWRCTQMRSLKALRCIEIDSRSTMRDLVLVPDEVSDSDQEFIFQG
jgi:hypothetical protein